MEKGDCESEESERVALLFEQWEVAARRDGQLTTVTQHSNAKPDGAINLGRLSARSMNWRRSVAVLDAVDKNLKKLYEDQILEKTVKPNEEIDRADTFPKSYWLTFPAF